MAATAAPTAAIPVRPVDVPLTGGRKAVVWTLIGLATLIAVGSILTNWVNRQMLSNDSWRDTSQQVIQDPNVRSALAVYLVNQLYGNVDVAGELQKDLPPNLKRLAGPLSGALRQPSTNAVEFLLQRPRVQAVWVNANQVAHQKLINVLENKTGNGISTGNGVVTLDLSPLVADLGTELGLPPSLLAKLPPNAGQIEVMRSDQLSTAQTLVQVLRALSVWLLALTLVLYGLAIYLARGHRRAILRDVGWAFIGVGLLVLVARRLLGKSVEGLAQTQYRGTIHDVWLIVTSIMGQLGRATILYGIIIVLGAVLAGPGKHATSVRRRLAPTLNERPGMAWGAAGGVYLLLVLWGGTHALRVWWGILLLGGLLAIGVAALRRQTLLEFPPEGGAVEPSPPAVPSEPAGA
jgi:hypothetical protein